MALHCSSSSLCLISPSLKTQPFSSSSKNSLLGFSFSTLSSSSQPSAQFSAMVRTNRLSSFRCQSNTSVHIPVDQRWMFEESEISGPPIATIIKCTTRSNPSKENVVKCAPVGIPGRRQALLLLTATTALKVAELPSKAQDIPLFGLRKKLKKVEEEAEEIVKEGFEAADKGIVAAGKGIEAAEKGLETAEDEIKSSVSFGGLAQAGVVAGAEVVGVLVATSIVNGILGPEAQKSS